jgi:hypothetical protein
LLFFSGAAQELRLILLDIELHLPGRRRADVDAQAIGDGGQVDLEVGDIEGDCWLASSGRLELSSWVSH